MQTWGWTKKRCRVETVHIAVSLTGALCICVALSQCIAGTGGKSPNITKSMYSEPSQMDSFSEVYERPLSDRQDLQDTANLTTIAANHMSYMGNYGSNVSYLPCNIVWSVLFATYSTHPCVRLQLAPSTSLDEQTLSSLQC